MAELSYTQVMKQSVIVGKFILPFLLIFGTYISRQECCTGKVECLGAERICEDLSGAVSEETVMSYCLHAGLLYTVCDLGICKLQF